MEVGDDLGEFKGLDLCPSLARSGDRVSVDPRRFEQDQTSPSASLNFSG
jgi:hypothetical protein